MSNDFLGLKQVDDYELIEKIGEGGQSVVFRARHRHMDRHVALKFLRPENSHDMKVRRAFRVETRISALLTHPRIMRAYDAGQINGLPYLVMELREGTDLAVRRKNHSVTAGDSIRLIRQAAEGLAFAHTQGVVHRDVKPANLFYTSDGEVLVFDWGLAKCPSTAADEPGDESPPRPHGPPASGAPASPPPPTPPAGEPPSVNDASRGSAYVAADAPSLNTQTVDPHLLSVLWRRQLEGDYSAAQTMAATCPPDVDHPPSPGGDSASWKGHIIGTPAFMAPEQAVGGEVDHRADIYSLGATLFSVLIGGPMRTGTLGDVLNSKVAGDVPSLRESGADVSSGLEEIYRAMVAKNPADRFQSMADVVRALHSVDGRNKVFISYRRQDSIDATDRIYSQLVRRIDAEKIFMDVDTIPSGLDYRSYLVGAISQSAVMLVVIGDHWVSTSTKGFLFRRRRIDDKNDWVRIEIETAIRQKIPVIPVLVGQAKLPEMRELPPSLRPILDYQSAEVRPGREYQSQIDQLIDSIQNLMR